MTSPLRSIAVAFVSLMLFAPPAWPQTCGDDNVEGDETCDDGNSVGGDGCAANCTDERRVTFALGGESRVNVQGRLRLAYDAPGLSPRGTLTLTVGAPRVGDASAPVPFVVLEEDARIEPVTLLAPACFCARAVVPDGFPAGVVAQGTLGCGAGGLPEVDYRLSRDHDITDVDPECATGTPNDDGHCVGPLERIFTAAGERGAATGEIGMVFYELSNCDATPGDADAQGCTADDPVSVPLQRIFLTTGASVGEIINADGSAATIAPGETCADAPCAAGTQGAPFDCDGILTDPPLAGIAALGGVDVGVHFAGLPDIVTVLRLGLEPLPTATPTVTVTETPVDTPTATATAIATATGTESPTEMATETPTEMATAGATATPTVVVATCAGDCDSSGAVGIEELIRGVSIALGALPLSACPLFDASGDGMVSVNELIQAVSAALNGCE